MGKDNCKTRPETFMFGDWVRLIFENWRYVPFSSQRITTKPSYWSLSNWQGDDSGIKQQQWHMRQQRNAIRDPLRQHLLHVGKIYKALRLFDLRYQDAQLHPISTQQFSVTEQKMHLCYERKCENSMFYFINMHDQRKIYQWIRWALLHTWNMSESSTWVVLSKLWLNWKRPWFRRHYNLVASDISANTTVPGHCCYDHFYTPSH